MAKYKIVYCKDCLRYSIGIAIKPTCRYCESRKTTTIKENVNFITARAEVAARNMKGE